MKKKIKKVTLHSLDPPFYKKDTFKVINKGAKNPTVVKSSQGIVGIILIIPLIVSAIWLINLLVIFLAPPPPEGVLAAPVSQSKILAATAFMVGYSIFLLLFYFYKKKK